MGPDDELYVPSVHRLDVSLAMRRWSEPGATNNQSRKWCSREQSSLDKWWETSIIQHQASTAFFISNEGKIHPGVC